MTLLSERGRHVMVKMALVQYGHDSESEEEDITTPIEKLPPGLGKLEYSTCDYIVTAS